VSPGDGVANPDPASMPTEHVKPRPAESAAACASPGPASSDASRGDDRRTRPGRSASPPDRVRGESVESCVRPPDQYRAPRLVPIFRRENPLGPAQVLQVAGEVIDQVLAASPTVVGPSGAGWRWWERRLRDSASPRRSGRQAFPTIRRTPTNRSPRITPGRWPGSRQTGFLEQAPH